MGVGRHAMSSPSAARHKMIRHASTSNAVLNGESDIFYEMVRVGGALIQGVTQSGSWSREIGTQCLRKHLDCQGRVRIQALKILPARPRSEWCLSYACMAAPRGMELPFRVVDPVRVAVLSGICHEQAEPYFQVWVPTDDGLF